MVCFVLSPGQAVRGSRLRGAQDALASLPSQVLLEGEAWPAAGASPCCTPGMGRSVNHIISGTDCAEH